MHGCNSIPMFLILIYMALQSQSSHHSSCWCFFAPRYPQLTMTMSGSGRTSAPMSSWRVDDTLRGCAPNDDRIPSVWRFISFQKYNYFGSFDPLFTRSLKNSENILNSRWELRIFSEFRKLLTPLSGSIPHEPHHLTQNVDLFNFVVITSRGSRGGSVPCSSSSGRNRSRTLFIVTSLSKYLEIWVGKQFHIRDTTKEVDAIVWSFPYKVNLQYIFVLRRGKFYLVSVF